MPTGVSYPIPQDPPSGYELIHRGELEESDLVWNAETGEYEDATEYSHMIGESVDCLFGVARSTN